MHYKPKKKEQYPSIQPLVLSTRTSRQVRPDLSEPESTDLYFHNIDEYNAASDWLLCVLHISMEYGKTSRKHFERKQFLRKLSLSCQKKRTILGKKNKVSNYCRKKIKAFGLEDHQMFKRPIKNFGCLGLRKENAIFNQRNKACFPLFCF